MSIVTVCGKLQPLQLGREVLNVSFKMHPGMHSSVKIIPDRRQPAKFSAVMGASAPPCRLRGALCARGGCVLETAGPRSRPMSLCLICYVEAGSRHRGLFRASAGKQVAGPLGGRRSPDTVANLFLFRAYRAGGCHSGVWAFPAAGASPGPGSAGDEGAEPRPCHRVVLGSRPRDSPGGPQPDAGPGARRQVSGGVVAETGGCVCIFPILNTAPLTPAGLFPRVHGACAHEGQAVAPRSSGGCGVKRESTAARPRGSSAVRSPGAVRGTVFPGRPQSSR